MSEQFERGLSLFRKGQYEEAFSVFIDAAQKGDSDAQNYVGKMYIEGKGVDENMEEGFNWSMKSANQGDKESQFNIGFMYYNGLHVCEDDDEALMWFTKAAEQGERTAQYYIGEMYFNGFGVPEDEKKAFDWYMKSAKQGDSDAQKQVGYFYDSGTDAVDEDKTEAFKWFLRAAKSGDDESQYNVGTMYYHGEGVREDKEEAFKWYMKSAEQGNTEAQYGIGKMYYEGIGVEKDLKKAKKYLLLIDAEDAPDAEVAKSLIARIESETANAMKTSDTLDLFTGSVFEIISQHYKDVFGNHGFIVQEITEKKMNGAIKGITKNAVTPSQVLLVHDQTILGSCSDGFLFTDDMLYYYGGMFTTRIAIKYNEISDVIYEKNITKDKNGKEKVNEKLKIIKGSDELEVGNLFVEQEKFVIFLKSIVASSLNQEIKENVIERNPLEEMPIEIRNAYLKVIIDYCLSTEKGMDQIALSQIYSLMTRLNFTAQDRIEIHKYINAPQSTSDHVAFIVQNVDDVAKQMIVFSIAKDLLYIHSQVNSAKYTESKFVMDFCKKYDVSDDKLDLIEAAIENDKKLYDDNIDDAGLESGFMTIAGTAAGVGVPLAALYFSGSVIGLGATGITSGLATLGMGGLFGLGGMATGIGAVVLLGFGAKKGIEHLTGKGALNKRKKKEFMLLEINKNLQRAINALMEDINYITQEISSIFAEHEQMKDKLGQAHEKIQGLVVKLRQLTGATALAAKERDNVAAFAARQSLPQILDIDRLTIVTAEPTKKKWFDVVISFYDNVGDEYRLKSEIFAEDAQNLSSLLQSLDYFSASSLAKQGIEEGKKRLGNLLKK